MADDPNTPPSAAEVVLKGTVTEETAAELARVREEREKLANTVREREFRISELEDQNRQLKEVTPKRKGFLDAMAEYFPSAD